MLIRCWGARGSIAVSGKEYIKYGGDTTCIEVESSSGDLFIIDAGTGIRRLGKRISSTKDDRLINILLTHAHWDHLSGFPFFKPLYFDQNRVAVYGSKSTCDSLHGVLRQTMAAPFFPVQLAYISADIGFNEIVASDSFKVGGMEIETIALSHPNEGVGYRLTENGKSFVFLTDNELSHIHHNGLAFDDYKEFSKGADFLIHDAEYNDDEYIYTRTWGHSTYKEAVRLALDAGVKKLGLFHLDPDRTDDGADEILADCKRIISEKGSELECAMVAQDMEFEI